MLRSFFLPLPHDGFLVEFFVLDLVGNLVLVVEVGPEIRLDFLQARIQVPGISRRQVVLPAEPERQASRHLATVLLRSFASFCRERSPPWRAAPRRPSPASCSSRSEEHTSELQSLMRISYAVFCLKKKNNKKNN